LTLIWCMGRGVSPRRSGPLSVALRGGTGIEMLARWVSGPEGFRGGSGAGICCRLFDIVI